MNKKEYKQPSMKVVYIENADLISTSTTTMSLFDDEVDEDQAPSDERSSIWGTQW